MSQQINLFNPKLQTQKLYFSLNSMVQALGLILLGSSMFYVYALNHIPRLNKQAEESIKRFAYEQARLSHISGANSPQQLQQTQAGELKKLEAQVYVQHELINTLKNGAMGNTSGYSAYMQAFARQAVNGMWITGFSITGDAVQMSLNGGTLSPELIPDYIKRLSREKVMRGKIFSGLEMQQHEKETGKSMSRSYLDFSLHTSDAGDKL